MHRSYEALLRLISPGQSPLFDLFDNPFQNKIPGEKFTHLVDLQTFMKARTPNLRWVLGKLRYRTDKGIVFYQEIEKVVVLQFFNHLSVIK